MSADLAAYTASDSSLDRLDRESVVALLERGKTWLTMAVERDTEIGDYVTFKGQAETVRVYTVQKQLGKDAELAAQELVRRAEAGIGRAVRKAQEAGQVARPGDIGAAPPPGGDMSRAPGVQRGAHLDRSSKYFANHAERSDSFKLAAASDADLDTAITEAKAEGNLSRANVVRKVTGRDKPKGRRPEVLRGTRRIDSRRVIAATVDGYANNAIPQDLFAEICLAELEENDLREWISSLSESAKALRSLRSTLEKELNQRA
jgi:hypothetical protein